MEASKKLLIFAPGSGSESFLRLFLKICFFVLQKLEIKFNVL